MRPLPFVSADEAVGMVKSHDHIHISSAGHVPFILIEALCRRANTHWIVTEYGAVDLTGLSLQERAKKIISVAHPEDRKFLTKAAFNRFGSHYKSI